MLAFTIAGKIPRNEDEFLLLGKMASNQNQNRERKEKILENIQNAEFKVFSQFGDDGIIQFLVDYLDIKEKTFIEFGVEDYLESNTRFLMMNNNWEGMVMDGSEENIGKIIKTGYYWKHNLLAKKLFVEQENINEFIKENGFSGKIGLLHIDIDGNDYWIWKKINVIEPAIVIIEYNSVFDREKPWVIPYDKDFYRTKAHSTNLFWGSSITSLCDLAEKKGYVFIGTNSAGNNAYFVKKGREKELKSLSSHAGYTESKYRESRNAEGKLTFIAGADRLKAIKGCEVYNTRTNKLEKI